VSLGQNVRASKRRGEEKKKTKNKKQKKKEKNKTKERNKKKRENRPGRKLHGNEEKLKSRAQTRADSRVSSSRAAPRGRIKIHASFEIARRRYASKNKKK